MKQQKSDFIRTFQTEEMARENQIALVGMVLGICSIMGCWCGHIGCPIVGMVFSMMGFMNANKLPGNPNKTFAIVGIITSVVGFALSIVGLIYQMTVTIGGILQAMKS